MPTMRFNHMELTFAPGTLDESLRSEIDDFYGDVFGFMGADTEVVGQLAHILLTDNGQQFILCAESPKHIDSPGYDHLGFLYDRREEVDELLDKCKRYQEKDDRVQIKEYEDLVVGDLVVHAFYVKHLLPIWFDVQCMERAGEPIPAWS
jgi:hypothetical protein